MVQHTSLLPHAKFSYTDRGDLVTPRRASTMTPNPAVLSLPLSRLDVADGQARQQDQQISRESPQAATLVSRPDAAATRCAKSNLFLKAATRRNATSSPTTTRIQSPGEANDCLVRTAHGVVPAYTYCIAVNRAISPIIKIAGNVALILRDRNKRLFSPWGFERLLSLMGSLLLLSDPDFAWTHILSEIPRRISSSTISKVV